MTRSTLRKSYPFHDAAPGATYSAEHVAAMMRARDARQARECAAKRRAIAGRVIGFLTIAGCAALFVYSLFNGFNP